jgi:hypothetical protein
MAYSTYYTKDNQPKVGEVCILVDADGIERLFGAINRGVVVVEEMDAQGHVYIHSEDIAGLFNSSCAYVDLWQLAPTKDVADMQLYSKDNKPTVGTLVSITEDAWYEPYHNTYQIVDRLGSTCIWFKGNAEYPAGICIPSDEVAKPVPRVAPAEADPEREDPYRVNPYNLPCDFKVGDEVESLIYGAGSVIAISTGEALPVQVYFDDGMEATHTSCGCWCKGQQRTLFHKDTVKLVAIEQQYKPEYPSGQLLYVMADSKIMPITVKRDTKAAVIDTGNREYKKSEFTFHLPA